MSTFNHLLDHQPQEHICYVQCGFCTTVLLVVVPYSCLSMVVTVKCGHCTSLLPVNMMGSTFLPLHFSSFVDDQEEPMVEAGGEEDFSKLSLSKHSSSPLTSSVENDDDDDLEVVNHVIRRLKTQDPNMSHKQAFSTAAKNNEEDKSKGSGGESTGMVQELGLDQPS
ncbi:putative transcription factor C2C2-YABBY family [Helianthus annuus]|nr:putative transcription factor C2C2-YABBY family [Helianthus annuus]KAJ0635181.1 putative transcription factor C2C2-YABBY family [Helianthus annuus]KAJ0824930.1 putative transcription factor C2C2-YABBY family [Helianthus annuus]